ncbi:RagB/SusD family nutrient uptake outer membrane protein, partial [Bacteroides intestinalis]
MKIKKYILSLLIGATALSFSSCNDFLDRDPLGQFTEDDAPNALVGGKIFNVYYLMRSYDITAGIPAFMVHMVRSEDSEKGSDAGDGGNEAAMWDDFEYTASNGPLAAYWGQNYKIIYQCNEILDDIANSDHKDDTESIRNRGEALFFRAYCYFNLVRAFGEVPLVTIKVVEASDANVPKTTAEKIYEQIDKDLTEAEKCLPLRWDSDYTGRLTWGAARSLHARTYMMRNDWENMYTASTDVVNSGIYNLNTPVDKVFTVEGENCGESIFELQCEATDAMKEDGSIGSQFCQVQGVRGAGNWDLGW